MFYILNLILVLYNIILYMFFREGIYDFLRLSKMSKTYIKKSRRGFRNYWLYSAIHKQHSLGILYYLNIIYLSYTLFFSVSTLALGYIKLLQPVLFIGSIVLLFIQIPCTVSSCAHIYHIEFGKPFILLTRDSQTKKLRSSLLDALSWILTALLIYLAYTQL